MLQRLSIITLLMSGLLMCLFATPLTAKKPPPVMVKTALLKVTQVENTIEAIGRTQAFESVTITTAVTEHIDKIFFKDGQTVKQDQLLVTLSNAREKAEMAGAKARLKEAKVQYERIVTLSKRNFLAKSEHDSRLAAVEMAQAKLEQIEASLDDRELKAPFAGILGFRKISPGTLVEPGDEIVELNQIQPLKVDFSIPERFFAEIKKGQTFTAKNVAYPKRVFKGQILMLNARLDNNTGSVRIRGELDNNDLTLRPGMILRISIKQATFPAALIPEQALVSADGKHWIFILEKNHAKKISVSIVRRIMEFVEITAMLPKNAQLIIDGAFKLKDGQAVKVAHVAL